MLKPNQEQENVDILNRRYLLKEAFSRQKEVCTRMTENQALGRSATHVGDLSMIAGHEDKALDGMFLAVNNLAPWKDEEMT